MNIPPLQPDFCIENQIFKLNHKSISLYTIIVLCLLLALISLPFINVDIIVRGVGSIRPSSEKAMLLSPGSDRILKICAKEGDLVYKGKPILMLNTASFDADILYQEANLLNLKNQITDLQLLVKGQEPTHFFSETKRQEFILFKERSRNALAQEFSANRKLERNKALYKSGIIPEDEFENFQLEKIRLVGERKTIVENQQSIWSTELNQLKIELKEVQSRLTQLLSEKSNYTLVAPVQGYLESFDGIHEGMNVTSGQNLGSISPNSTLLVENYLEPKDIAFIYKGMPVKIVSESFDYNQWGFINGKVSDIASDYQLIDNRPFYKIKCSLDRTFLSLKNGRKGFLKKGMNVQTRFMANRRSLFQLIYQKMDDWFNPSIPNKH